MHVKSASFSTDNSRTSRLSISYRTSNNKNFIPKYLDNAPYRFRLNLTNNEAASGGKSSCELWRNSFQCREIVPQVKWVIASFCCQDNSDVIATLIITDFHLYLIQLWWQFFQIFMLVLGRYPEKLYRATLLILFTRNLQ